MKCDQRIIFTLCCFLATGIDPISAQLWKGETGDFPALRQAAGKGDPESMAEYAWHLIEGHGDRPYVAGEIYGLFEKSAAKGNALGKVGLSRCLVGGIGTDTDLKKAWMLAEEAAEAGHPEGWKQMGLLLCRGLGVPLDRERGRELMEKAAALGSVAAESNLLGMDFVTKNLSERYRLQSEIALRCGLMNATSDAIRAYYFQRKDPGERGRHRKLIAILEDRAARNHPEALYSLALVRGWQGDSDGKAMLMARSVLTGVGVGVSELCQELSHAQNPALKRTYSYFYTTEESRRGLEWLSYRRGARSDAGVIAAAQALAKGFGDRKPDPDTAIRLLTSRLPGKNKQMHRYVALIYLPLIGKEGREDAAKLALAHAIYSSDKDRASIGIVCHLYSGAVAGMQADLPKARAAHRLMPDRDPTKAPYGRRFEGKLTPEQIAESDRLIEEGFPKAGKFIEEAREILAGADQLTPKWE